MKTTADIRVCFVGDSFVAGIGDPDHRGWVGHVCAEAAARGTQLTAYNLGVRRETSADIARRWLDECVPRLLPGCLPHVVFSFGVNDTTLESGHDRIAPHDSAAHARQILQTAKTRYTAVMIGPPPVADSDQNRRIQTLSKTLDGVCRELQIPYLPVFEPLTENPVWMRQVNGNDGAHPRSEGYKVLAQLVIEWRHWPFRSIAT